MTKTIITLLLFTFNLNAAAEDDSIETLLGIKIPAEMRLNPTWFGGLNRFEAKLIHAYRHFTPKSRILIEEACARQNKYLKELGFKPDEKPSFTSFALQPLVCLASLHTPSKEESTYFQLTSQCELYRCISTNKKPSIEEVHRAIKIPSCYPKLSNLLSEINIDRDRTIIVPIVGHGELGFAFLISCFLNEIFPYGISIAPHRGHGIDFTSLGFAVHDLAHIEAHGHVQKLIKHFTKTILNNAINGCTSKDISNIYIPIAKQKENLRRQIFLSILQDIIEKDDLKSLIAYFLIVHEDILNYDYDDYDLGNNLNKLFNSIIENYFAQLNWESDIECDFKTGFTTLTDEEIALLCNDSISPEDIKEVEVERTDRFLIVTKLELLKDIKVRVPIAIPLIKDKLRETEDLSKLLAIAGFTTPHAPTELDMSCLSFEGQIEAIELYIDDILDKTKSLFEHFNTFIESFAKEHEIMYRTKLENLDKEFQEKLRILVDTTIKQE